MSIIEPHLRSEMCLGEELEHISKKGKMDLLKREEHMIILVKKQRRYCQDCGPAAVSILRLCQYSGFLRTMHPYALHFCLLIIHLKGPSCHRLEICK